MFRYPLKTAQGIHGEAEGVHKALECLSAGSLSRKKLSPELSTRDTIDLSVITAAKGFECTCGHRRHYYQTIKEEATREMYVTLLTSCLQYDA